MGNDVGRPATVYDEHDWEEGHCTRCQKVSETAGRYEEGGPCIVYAPVLNFTFQDALEKIDMHGCTLSPEAARKVRANLSSLRMRLVDDPHHPYMTIEDGRDNQ